MTALSDDLQVLLDAERDIDVPAPAERQRMFERLEPLLVVPLALAAAGAVTQVSTAGATAAEASAVADTAGSALLGGALKAKIAAAVVSAALIGGGVGAAGHAYLASEPAPRPKAAEAVAPVLPQPKQDVPVPPEPAIEPAAAPSTPVPLAPSAPRQDSARPAGSLRAERLLIETASAALLRGDHQAALAALRQHAQRFPKGSLAEEREVLLGRARAASSGAAPAEKRAKDSPQKNP